MSLNCVTIPLEKAQKGTIKRLTMKDYWINIILQVNF